MIVARQCPKEELAWKLHPRDRLQIAVPDLLLVGLRQVDALENAQRLAGIYGAPLRIERASGGEHDLVEVVEGKPGMGRRHAAEHRGVGIEVVLEIIERALLQALENLAQVLVQEARADLAPARADAAFQHRRDAAGMMGVDLQVGIFLSNTVS